MDTESDMQNGLNLRTVGMNLCLISIVAVVCSIALSIDTMDIRGILFYSAFQLPVPVIALCMFLEKRSRLTHVHGLALMVPYMILMVLFWCIAPGEAAKDAQGGLIYVFGPIYIQVICLVWLGLFSLGYFIYRRVRSHS